MVVGLRLEPDHTERGPLGSERHLAPDHRPGQGRSIGFCGGDPLDHRTLTHDRDLVGGPQDLVELVAHEHHRSPLGRDDVAE